MSRAASSNSDLPVVDLQKLRKPIQNFIKWCGGVHKFDFVTINNIVDPAGIKLRSAALGCMSTDMKTRVPEAR